MSEVLQGFAMLVKTWKELFYLSKPICSHPCANTLRLTETLRAVLEKVQPSRRGWGWVGRKKSAQRSSNLGGFCSRKQTILNCECIWKPDRPGRSQSELIVAPFLNAKNYVRFWTWKVRSMLEITRSAQVVTLMSVFRLDILIISECLLCNATHRPTIPLKMRRTNSTAV